MLSQFVRNNHHFSISNEQWFLVAIHHLAPGRGGSPSFSHGLWHFADPVHSGGCRLGIAVGHGFSSDLAWWLDRLTHLYYINYLLWLVVTGTWLGKNFPSFLGNVIIPTDEVIFFSMDWFCWEHLNRKPELFSH